MTLIKELTDEFGNYETEIAGRVKHLMSMMNPSYNMEYLVYSASVSLSDEEFIWDTELHKVFRRMMFKKFDSYIEEELTRKNGN